MKKFIVILICLLFSFSKSNFAQKIFLFLNGTNYYLNSEVIKNKQIKNDRGKDEIVFYFEVQNFYDSTLTEKINIKLKNSIFRNEIENSKFEFNQKKCKIFIEYHDKWKTLYKFNTDLISSESIIGQFQRINLNKKSISFSFFLRYKEIVFEGSFENILINNQK